MSLVLSADLSLNSSGICIIRLDTGTPVHYEHITSDREGIERLHYNYSRYLNVLSTYRDISCIAFEAQNKQMRFSYSAGSLVSLAENVGIWKLAIYHSIPNFIEPPVVLSIPAQDIKTYATGNGKATKEEMIAAVNGTHLRSIRRDIPEHSVNDIADAYHLARMAREYILHKQDTEEYKKYLIADYRKILPVAEGN